MISPEQCKLVLETQDVFWKYYIEVHLCLLARRPIASEHPRSQSCLGVATRCSDVCLREVAQQKVDVFGRSDCTVSHLSQPRQANEPFDP